MDPKNVSIVMPALNEAEGVGHMVRGLVATFPTAEIIVINDGSSDDTAKIAAAAGAHVITHDRNRGYGASLRTGTEAATRDYVLFCDSDGQHTVEDIGRVMEACEDSHMVVGARRDTSHVPLARRPGKYVLRKFANYLADEQIPDLNSGLRIVNRPILKKYLHLMPRGFSFSTTTTFAMLKTDRRVKWIPLTVRKRVGVSSIRQWKHGPQTALLMLRLTVLFEPLRVFLTIASCLAVFTMLSLTVDLVVSSGTDVGDSTVMLALTTLLVFLFRLLCDQVSSLRRESHE